MSVVARVRHPRVEGHQLGQRVPAWRGVSSPSWVDQAPSCGPGTGSLEQQERSSLEAQTLLICLGLLLFRQTEQVPWPESVWEGLQIFTIYPRPCI